MLDWISNFAISHYILVYPLLFLLAFIQGQLVALVAGFVARLGFLDPYLAGACIALGNVIGDVAWYEIGQHKGERFVLRFGRYFGLNDDSIAWARRVFDRYHSRILLASKLTNGLGLAIIVLFTAGMTRVPFGKYLAINAAGESVWTGALVAAGFFFGQLYVTIDNVLGRSFLFAGALAVAYLAYRAAKYARSRMEKI